MKKILSVLLTALMVLASVSGLSVLAANECDLYGHRYGDWGATQTATCTVVGLETRKCEFCNDIQTRTVGLNPDNHVGAQIVNSNENGTHVLRCVDCNELLTRNCTYGAWVNNGDGTDSHTCYFCRYVQSAPCVFGACASDAENPGTHVRACGQCGTTRSEACVFVREGAVAATCTGRGYTGLYCECGNVSVTQIIDALGHTAADANGKCSRCGEVLVPAPTEPTDPGEAEKSFLDKIMEFFQKIIEWFTKLFA